MSEQPRTGLVFDDRYLQHNSNPLRLPKSREPLPFVEAVDHPSNPRLVERTMRLLGPTGLQDQLKRISGQRVTEEDLLVYHTEWYLEHVRKTCDAGGGDAGQGAPIGRGSYEVAMHAAGGVKAAVDAVMTDQVQQCYALVRPPGHHAMSEKGMGFCVFGNVVAAAHHARSVYGLERVLILDWDVHHGNGTQDIFYDREDVYVISIHEGELYPGTGEIDEVGTGDGDGATMNIPMPAGTDDVDYLAAVDGPIRAGLEAFDPELLLISAGFDAHRHDPISRVRLTTEAYALLTDRLRTIATDTNAALAFVLEGGYGLDVLADSIAMVHETFDGREPIEPDGEVSDVARPVIEDVMAAHGFDT